MELGVGPGALWSCFYILLMCVQENAELNGFPREENAIYLADAGYGLRKEFLTHYWTIRYHLHEQSLARQCPQTKEQFFNLPHAQLRNVIECLFGILRRSFRILNTAPEYNLDTQAQLVLVICALHNFIRHQANGEDDEFYRASDLSEDLEDEGNGIESYTNDRAEDTKENKGTQDMKEMLVERDRRATKMWIDYVNYQNSTRQNYLYWTSQRG